MGIKQFYNNHSFTIFFVQYYECIRQKTHKTFTKQFNARAGYGRRRGRTRKPSPSGGDCCANNAVIFAYPVNTPPGKTNTGPRVSPGVYTRGRRRLPAKFALYVRARPTGFPCAYRTRGIHSMNFARGTKCKHCPRVQSPETTKPARVAVFC